MSAPTRRAVIGAITCTPALAVSCTPQPAVAQLSAGEWNQRLAHYERCKVLYDADRKFGRYAHADAKFRWMRGCLEKEHGSLEKAKLDPAIASEWEKVWEEMAAAETANSDLYFYPMDEAAKALINTPAPDVRAIEVKLQALNICAIGADELDIMAIVRADVQRLAGEA